MRLLLLELTTIFTTWRKKGIDGETIPWKKVKELSSQIQIYSGLRWLEHFIIFVSRCW